MATLPLKLETLPEDIRALLRSDEFVEKIELIGEKQSLPPMEQGFLVRICAKLVAGILPPANFVNTIAEELDISREKAAFIAQEVNRDIFSNIKESLKALHSGEQKPTETLQSAKVTPSEVRPDASATTVTPSMPVSTITPRATPAMSAPTLPPLPPTPTLAVPPPPLHVPSTPTQAPQEITPEPKMNPQGETQPHIGSIFEQKLGGEFRLKSDAVAYTNQATGDAVAANPTITPGI